MITEAKEKDKKQFNSFAQHPLQSWGWGEFRKKTGAPLTRLIETRDGKVKSVYQITWHRVPKTKLTIGYCPKSAVPNEEVLKWIEKEARSRKAIFVKFEPNERQGVELPSRIVAGESLFTKNSFVLDISKSEEELLAKMSQKTRYNIRLALKRGVEIVEDKSKEGFEDYWKLTEETTKRQNFYSHTRSYHESMWKEMVLEGNGTLLKAVYKDRVLAAWILFELNGVWYYPYGASSSEYREVMASNLMMWEAIRLGKKRGCNSFDRWGSLGENPSVSDKWYGFHKFKQGYGGELVEFVGSYDLVINPFLYKVYGIVNWLRWRVLKKWRT